MDASVRNSPVWAVVVVGVVYAVIGIGFAALAGGAASGQMLFVWRLAAWVASAAVFAVHFGYEHFRLGSRTLTTASHTAAAVAVGAFLLAAAAAIRAATVEQHAPYWQYLTALAAFPIITAVPAFVVALAVGSVLKALSKRA